MTTTIPNGRPQRKQLSDQLDRLDGIIDTLAEGLNKAVSDAAREGSREAVKEILTELLTNPDVLTLIRSTVGSMFPPPPPMRESEVPPAATKPAAAISASATIAGRVAKAVKKVRRAVASCVSNAWGTVKETARTVRRSPRLKKAILIGTGIGVVTAIVASTNHHLASALSGAGAAATAVGVQIGCWFRRARRSLRLA
jgi:hypothetical protein